MNVRRYQAEYEEQVEHVAGHRDGSAWAASPDKDVAEMIAFISPGRIAPGKHQVTWKLLMTDTTASGDDPVVELSVFAGDRPLAKKLLRCKDFPRPNEWRSFTLEFTGSGESDLLIGARYLLNAGMKVDHITVRIGKS